MATATGLKCTLRCSSAPAGDGITDAMGRAGAVSWPQGKVLQAMTSAGLHLGGEKLRHLGGGVSTIPAPCAAVLREKLAGHH